MKIYLPVYTTAINEPAADALVNHQKALHAALRYPSAKPEEQFEYLRHVGFKKNAALDAVAHAKKIFAVLDLKHNEVYDSTAVATWFHHAVYKDKKEYVFIGERWYERKWKKSELPKAKSKQAVIFVKDWTSAHQISGLAILMDRTKVRMLESGLLMAQQSKRIRTAAYNFIKNLKETDFDSIQKKQARLDSIEDQFIRDRGLKANTTVLEILSEARMLAAASPVTPGDSEFFRSNGIIDVYARLQLAAYQTRKQQDKIEFVICDSRLVRPTYDSNQHGHNAMAKGISTILDYYAKAPKL